LKHIGHHVEALTEIRRAEELDPLSVGLKANEASVLSFMQRGDQAIQMTRQAIAAEPDAGTHHDTLGFIYCSSGMYDEAAAEFREGMRFDGESTSMLCYLGFALAKSGRRSQAEAILSRLKTTKEYVSPVELGALYVGLGQYDIALQLLEEGYKTHDLQMQFLKTDLTYDAIRSDPRFVEMIRRVGLPD
jgi:tetratricopeptide (TPR) repeat protein